MKINLLACVLVILVSPAFANPGEDDYLKSAGILASTQGLNKRKHVSIRIQRNSQEKTKEPKAKKIKIDAAASDAKLDEIWRSGTDFVWNHMMYFCDVIAHVKAIDPASAPLELVYNEGLCEWSFIDKYSAPYENALKDLGLQLKNLHHQIAEITHSDNDCLTHEIVKIKSPEQDELIAAAKKISSQIASLKEWQQKELDFLESKPIEDEDFEAFCRVLSKLDSIERLSFQCVHYDILTPQRLGRILSALESCSLSRLDIKQPYLSEEDFMQYILPPLLRLKGLKKLMFCFSRDFTSAPVSSRILKTLTESDWPLETVKLCNFDLEEAGILRLAMLISNKLLLKKVILKRSLVPFDEEEKTLLTAMNQNTINKGKFKKIRFSHSIAKVLKK